MYGWVTAESAMICPRPHIRYDCHFKSQLFVIRKTLLWCTERNMSTEYEYILYTSQADMMKHEIDTRHNATTIGFLWPDGGAMEFIQDCHIHLFRVEESSNVWIWGKIGQHMCMLEQLSHSWQDVKLCRTLTPLIKSYSFHCQSSSVS